MAKFHLYKETRIYCGFPYNGSTSGGMNAEYDTIEEAREMAKEFQKRNPVGWNIWDAETGKLIEGYDHFKEE